MKDSNDGDKIFKAQITFTVKYYFAKMYFNSVIETFKEKYPIVREPKKITMYCFITVYEGIRNGHNEKRNAGPFYS